MQDDKKKSRSIAWMWAIALPLLLAPIWMTIDANVQLPGKSGTIVGMLVILLMVVVSYTDIRWRLIPNWATYTALIYGLLLNALAGQSSVANLGAIGLTESLVGGCVLFLALLVIFSFTGGGAGDVKLAACIGTLFGLSKGIDAVAYSFVCAGVVLLCWAVLSVGPQTIFQSLYRRVGHFCFPMWVSPPVNTQQKLLKTKVPLAPFFAVGSILVLLDLEFSKVIG